MLVRLTYCSRAHKSVDSDLVDDIMIAARKYNPAQGITGVLCYSKDVFVQSLEGGRAEVNLLYQKLSHDPRHQCLTLLDYQEVEQRRFANWSMAEVMMEKLNTSLLLRYSAQARLDPFNLPGASTALLLEALAEAGSTQIRH
ncbi:MULTISPECIES: BLUF domain-containing protein [Chromobacterium]|uniref:BLUF domain-containing protein n=2 Tax=Chromobacterium TaxID=535 RepID=A0ABS3GK48_9NEIS|nr:MULTISPECIES: BLUF domain-containing protein [Chromobacterium]AXT45794.1 BLUF domain-containing protein [Chromobacterium rhizoryzae]MBK0413897.1 BLUF domain-containing protein [Chromobacterium haemolyticum]MBO0415416.1 BLUF domain-containing protein [Chromobacterium haemolyticum]MBO0498677.1 BLUF domain-containing protein [Chromobacterium haemolyticum]MDH0340751.1 BLUF domain-containing protein [Chromobacterium haemolyticum]